MSLTTMLSGKTETALQFQSIIKTLINPRPVFTTVSGKKAFSSEYEQLVPYNLSNPYYSGMVGMGFDYMARFIIAKTTRDKVLKCLVLKNLAAERGLNCLERIVDKKTYKVLDKKFGRALALIEMFINNQIKDMTELLYSVGYLSSLEAVARTGMPPVDIKKSLIDDVSYEIIYDMQQMCGVFNEKFVSSGIIKEQNNEIIFNPTFGLVSMFVGGADADLFLNGTLLDFKCTKDKGYKWVDFAQLVAYYLLSIISVRCGDIGIINDETAVNRLAFYRGRFGEIEYIDVKLLGEDKIEYAISELQKLWGLK
jgi:hypothetical protein